VDSDSPAGLELLETLSTYFSEHHIRVEVILVVAMIALAGTSSRLTSRTRRDPTDRIRYADIVARSELFPRQKSSCALADRMT